MSVDVRDLTHQYGDRIALDAVTFDAPAGRIFGVIGPNGSGKSTLFKILATALAPTSGTARIAGIDLRDATAVRRKIGVVFQSPSLDKKLTVVENLRCQGHLYGLGGNDLRGRIDEMMKRFQLENVLAEKLSGGFQRRVEIAKGLLHRPEALLLDEPSTGLDPGARRDLGGYLRALAGVTVLLTTHLMEEAERCDHLAILHRGKLVALGTPEAMRSEIGGDVVTIRSRNIEPLRAELGGEVVDGELRISSERGHELAAKVYERFRGQVDAVTVARPSLEDVYFRKTREAWR